MIIIISYLKPYNCLKRKTLFGIKGWHAIKPTTQMFYIFTMFQPLNICINTTYSPQTDFPGVTWHLYQVGVIKLITCFQEAIPTVSTGLEGLSLSLGIWDTPKLGMLKESSIFCDIHAWVSDLMGSRINIPPSRPFSEGAGFSQLIVTVY